VLDESMGRRWGNDHHMPGPKKDDGPAEVGAEQPIFPQRLAAVPSGKRVQPAVPPNTDRPSANTRLKPDPAESRHRDAGGEEKALYVKIAPLHRVAGHGEEDAQSENARQHQGDAQSEEMGKPGGNRDRKISSDPYRQDKNRPQRRNKFETLGPWGG